MFMKENGTRFLVRRLKNTESMLSILLVEIINPPKRNKEEFRFLFDLTDTTNLYIMTSANCSFCVYNLDGLRYFMYRWLHREYL